jgi:hypothetical protein
VREREREREGERKHLKESGVFEGTGKARMLRREMNSSG